MADIHSDVCKKLHSDAEGFYVLGASGAHDYIRFDGTNVHSFHVGWSSLFLYSGLNGLYILELCHENGQRATWFLDKRFEYLCNSVANLPAPYAEALSTAARSLRDDIWTQLMLVAAPVLLQRTRDFFCVNKSTRGQVLMAAQTSDLSEATIINMSSHAEPTVHCACANRKVVLQRVHLDTIMRSPIKEKFIGACTSGRLTWPSPIDEAPMRLLGGFFIDDFRFAYKMFDECAKLVVVIVVTEHNARTIAVLIPAGNLILVASSMDADHLEAHFGRLVTCLEYHCWDHALALERYLGPYDFVFASVLREGAHIGHHLWNELSPLEEIVRVVPAERLPLFVVPNAAEGTEIYGPLDVLFPELAGRVQRFNTIVAEIIPEAYARGFCVIRITDIHVPTDLRSRILTVAAASHAGQEARAAAEAISAMGVPMLLLGLRVENRTLVDLPRFLIDLIEHVIDHLGPVVFVIDGHNSRPGTDPQAMFVSHMEHAAKTRPHDEERRIVGLLEAHFAGSRASIVSAIGAPISSSLVWCSHSKAFLAMWGAGLAKYRWATNTPGFVVSSAWNLRQRPDLHIYCTAQYMEDPTEVFFANPACVMDQANQHSTLVAVAGDQDPSSYVNFDVAVEALWPQIGAFLASVTLGA